MLHHSNNEYDDMKYDYRGKDLCTEAVRKLFEPSGYSELYVIALKH